MSGSSFFVRKKRENVADEYIHLSRWGCHFFMQKNIIYEDVKGTWTGRNTGEVPIVGAYYDVKKQDQVLCGKQD